MTVASRVRGPHRERVFLHSMSHFIFFWYFWCCFWCFWWSVGHNTHHTENQWASSRTQFQLWGGLGIYSSFIHQTKHHLDKCSQYCSCSQTSFYFCNQQQEVTTKWQKNTNHGHMVYFPSSAAAMTSYWFSPPPPPHPGLLWAVFLFCLTREMDWVQESEPVLRTSLQPALTLSSCWRNTATGRWE